MHMMTCQILVLGQHTRGVTISPSGLDALLGTTPQKEESKGVRSVTARPNYLRAPVKSRFKALPPSTRTFLKSTFSMVASRTRGNTLCRVCPPTGRPC